MRSRKAPDPNPGSMVYAIPSRYRPSRAMTTSPFEPSAAGRTSSMHLEAECGANTTQRPPILVSKFLLEHKFSRRRRHGADCKSIHERSELG